MRASVCQAGVEREERPYPPTHLGVEDGEAVVLALLERVVDGADALDAAECEGAGGHDLADGRMCEYCI